LRKASWYWKIPLKSLSNHLIGKTTSIKCGPLGVLLVDEEALVLEWVFGMHECGLSNFITLVETQTSKINTNSCNTIQKWHPWNLMVALI
jgi:hypothetical protein